MTSPEFRNHNLAQFVCERPRLFTPNGTLSEVVAFLAGCDYVQSNALPEDESPAQVIAWLLRDVMKDSDISPTDRMATAVASYGSTEEGLKAIKEFADTINGS